MRLIGLTGSIGSGKSTVAGMLKELGAPVIDADAIVHQLQQPGTPVLAAIAATFGPGVIRPDGALDRAALGQIVFADPARRKALESIVHPAVRERIWQQVDQVRLAGHRAVVLDIPLLYESGWERLVDEVWVVWVDPETQVARLSARDGLAPAEAARRIGLQLSLDTKRERADRVIDNRGARAETHRQVVAAWAAALGPPAQ